MDNDHRIAQAPARRMGIPVVRTSYYGTGFPRRRTFDRLLAGTRFLIEPSRVAFEHDFIDHAMPRERMRVIAGAVDTERFNPAREVPDGRRWLGIPADAFVVGIVARMQLHRQFEVLWEGIRRLMDENIRVHVLVVGRGTNQEKVARGPVFELGLEQNVHFSGFVEGENYVGMLKAFDVKVFLVPGSDGTCRAVREAMSMAKPAVVANRGMLSEIVEDGKSGYVFDGTSDGLYKSLLPLTSDRSLVRRVGKAARETAVSQFSLEKQARSILGIYHEILGW